MCHVFIFPAGPQQNVSHQIERNPTPRLQFPNDTTNDSKKIESKGNIFDTVFNFAIGYWIVCIYGILMHGTMITWNDIAINQLYIIYNNNNNYYSLTFDETSNLLTIFWITAILTPISGFIIDRVGHLCELMILSSSIVAIAHFFIYVLASTSGFFDIYDC